MRLKYYIVSFYFDIILKQNKVVKHIVAKLYNDIHSTLTVSCEKSEIVSFAFLIVTNVN